MQATILLVYNDGELAERLKEYLSNYEYEVKILLDAELVLDFMENHLPDLLVLDALLQKSNGFEICQALKAHPTLQHIPIIMTSAIYISDEEISAGVQFGRRTYPILADLCVMKPFDPDDLLQHIRSLMGEVVETSYTPSILVVDDEKDIRDLLRATMTAYDYRIREASSGQECFDSLASSVPDVILLDYKLSDMSGIEVLKEIRKQWPDIAVILITAYGNEDLAIHAIEEHVDAYIRKPFLVENLLAVLSQTLERSRIKQERKQLIAQLRESNREMMKNYERLEDANRQLRELDKLKSEFLANVGHELRTPLNSIIGFTELVLQGYSGDLTEDQSRQLSMVLNSGNHLLRVLNDVIELSMLNAGQVALKQEVIPIGLVIKDVVQELRHIAQRKHLNIITNLDEHLANCYSSREKIRLILYNLLDNALKFSSSGDIIISTMLASTYLEQYASEEERAEKTTLTADFLLISVQDQGIGISPENFDILFDEFRQVDGSLTREYNGTGLGLAISKKLVTLYGGEIWLNSQLNVGSTFYFTVPLKNFEEGL